MVAGVTRALSRYVAIIIYHIYVVGGLCYIEGNFTTVILCMYHS